MQASNKVKWSFKNCKDQRCFLIMALQKTIDIEESFFNYLTHNVSTKTNIVVLLELLRSKFSTHLDHPFEHTNFAAKLVPQTIHHIQTKIELQINYPRNNIISIFSNPSNTSTLQVFSILDTIPTTLFKSSFQQRQIIETLCYG